MSKRYINLKETLPFMSFCFTPTMQAIMEAEAKYQEDVIRVMTVLPGKYRYEQVEAAINASGVSLYGLYIDLCANQRTFALERFYVALGILP